MKERSKKKWMRSTWPGHVDKMGDEKLAESRKRRGNGGKEDRNCYGDCIKSDLEKVG